MTAALLLAAAQPTALAVPVDARFRLLGAAEASARAWHASAAHHRVERIVALADGRLALLRLIEHE